MAPLSVLVTGSSGFIGIINGDGSQRRDLTHVADVARAVELALRWRGPGAVVLNVGTGRNHSVLDMLEAARKTTTPLVEHHAPTLLTCLERLHPLRL